MRGAKERAEDVTKYVCEQIDGLTATEALFILLYAINTLEVLKDNVNKDVLRRVDFDAHDM